MKLRVLTAVVVVGVWVVAWSVSVREDPPAAPPPTRVPAEPTPALRETAPTMTTGEWARRLVTPSGGISDEGMAAIVRGGRASLGTLGELLTHEDEAVRNAALDALSQLGPVAREIGPRVVEVMLDDPNEFVIYHAMSTVVSIGGEPVIRRLLAALVEPRETDRRICAFYALGVLGAAAREHAPALLPLLEDPEPIIRGSAIRALSDLGGETALKALLDMALSREESHSLYRKIAVEAIGYMGAPARSAVGALSSLLPEPGHDLEPQVILSSLARIGGDRALQQLVDHATSTHPEIDRQWAVTCIGWMGADAGTAVPVLLEWMEDRHLGDHARHALSRIAGDVTVASLATMVCEDPSALRRRHAADVLGRIGPGAASAVPALISALADVDDDVKGWAASALGRIGPAAASALPALRLLRKSDDEQLRKASLQAILMIRED
jgi:HEAT repeat protein